MWEVKRNSVFQNLRRAELESCSLKLADALQFAQDQLILFYGNNSSISLSGLEKKDVAALHPPRPLFCEGLKPSQLLFQSLIMNLRGPLRLGISHYWMSIETVCLCGIHPYLSSVAHGSQPKSGSTNNLNPSMISGLNLSPRTRCWLKNGLNSPSPVPHTQGESSVRTAVRNEAGAIVITAPKGRQYLWNWHQEICRILNIPKSGLGC